jgi:hypothetical protein
MNTTKIIVAAFAMASLYGCAGTEEYEVTGEVASAQTVSGPIALQFFELEDVDDAARVSIKESQLDAPGTFSETVEATSGASIIVSALVDDDGDGACSEGELWAEQALEPDDDGVFPAAQLTLTNAACPVP